MASMFDLVAAEQQRRAAEQAAFVGAPVTGGVGSERSQAAEGGGLTLGPEWTKTGGNNTTNVYTNSQTGEIIYFTPSTGRIDRFADQAAVDAADAQQSGPGQVVGDFKDKVLDQGNVAGTPGIDPSVSEQVEDRVIDVANGGTGGIPTVIGPDGVNMGGGFSLGAGITDPIQAAIAQQNAIAQQMGQERANFQGTAAPTIATPEAIQAAMAAQVDPIQAAQAQAQQAEAANIAKTVLTPQQKAIQAQQIEAAQIGQLQQAQTAQVAPTQVGPTALATAAQIDPGLQAQIRASQMGLVSGLEGAIAGKEPSVAEIMLRSATDRNVANQYALAQGATGMNTGLAQRTAMINAADLNQQAIMQQAILRAQEIAAARGQLGGVLDSTRGADIGLATNQAGLQQQTGLANTGALNTANLTQAQIAAQAAIQQAQLQGQASQFNAGQANAATVENAQLAQQAALANQQTGLQAGTTNATLAQQTALANAAAQNTTAQQNAQMQQAASLQNAQAGTQAAIANAANTTGANTASAQLSNAVNLANAQNQSQANLATGQLQTQAALANATNQVSTNALNQKAQQDLAANQLQAAGQAGQTSIGYGDVAAKMAEAEAKRQAALIGGISAGAAALISDRRAKTDVRSAEAELAGWTSTLGAHAFKYKDPARAGAAPGQRYGTMVDELEKSRVGRSLVRELDDGTKAVDVPQSVGAILATLAAMSRRQDRLEARR